MCGCVCGGGRYEDGNKLGGGIGVEYMLKNFIAVLRAKSKSGSFLTPTPGPERLWKKRT